MRRFEKDHHKPHLRHRIEHVQIIHGMKWYGSNLGPYRTPAKESHPRLPLPNFYYDQLDAIIGRQTGQRWSWSSLRPHFVCGLTVGSPSNPLSTLGAYAAILKAQGRPLDFPGPQGSFDAALNITDVRLLCRAMEWAATEPLSRVALPSTGEVLLVVGPEGGIASTELDALVAAGATPVRLGTEVLRTSSAGPAAIAVLNAMSRWC